MVRVTRESTSYGCKTVSLNIKEWSDPGVVVRATRESTSCGCKTVTLNIKE